MLCILSPAIVVVGGGQVAGSTWMRWDWSDLQYTATEPINNLKVM